MIAPEERGEIRTALLAKIEEIKNGIRELEVHNLCLITSLQSFS